MFQDYTRFKWHLFIYDVLNGNSLFPFQEALEPISIFYLFFLPLDFGFLAAF
jgi:hypothetical protein